MLYIYTFLTVMNVAAQKSDRDTESNNCDNSCKYVLAVGKTKKRQINNDISLLIFN